MLAVLGERIKTLQMRTGLAICTLDDDVVQNRNSDLRGEL
jgi:hypothetical protein